MKIENYLPSRVLAWAFAEHLKIKLVNSLPAGVRGTYNVTEDVILLDSTLDCKEEAKKLTERLCQSVEPAAVHVALLFHEAGHFFSRKKLDEIGHFQGTDMETLLKVRAFRNEREHEAWAFTIQRFSEWKFNMWDQSDFRKWRDDR